MVTRAALLVALAACSSVELAAPRVRDRIGPAADRPVKRVVALPSTCGTLEPKVLPSADNTRPATVIPAECSAPALSGIDQIIRTELDFGGFEMIDGERVNVVTGTRHEVEKREAAWGARKTTQVGASFEDATPVEQADILRELGADGILTTRIWVGAGVGAGGRRGVSVLLRMASASDRALVWAHRCDIEVGGLMDTDQLAIERAVRCAVKGVHAR